MVILVNCLVEPKPGVYRGQTGEFWQSNNNLHCFGATDGWGCLGNIQIPEISEQRISSPMLGL